MAALAPGGGGAGRRGRRAALRGLPRRAGPGGAGLAGPKPSPEEDPAAFAGWLGEATEIGFATHRDWSRLPVPPADAAEAETVLNLYRNWLTLSESASLALAAGEPEVAEDQLRQARRTGRAYQRTARQSGFRDCANVVPSPP
jgi:hypothetical protein